MKAAIAGRAALFALLAALAGVDAGAQQPTTGNRQVDLVCLEIFELKSVADIRRYDNSKHKPAEREAIAAENALSELRNNPATTAAIRKAEADKARAKQRRIDADVELSGLLMGYPRVEDYEAERTKLQAELRNIRELEKQYEDAKQNLSVYGKSSIGDRQAQVEVLRLQKEVKALRTTIDKADESGVQDRLNKTTEERAKKQGRIVVLRESLPGLNASEQAAERALERAQRPLAEAQAEAYASRQLAEAMRRCLSERHAQLDPGQADALKRLDEVLASLERSMLQIEEKAKGVLARCPTLDGIAKAAQSEAAELDRAADRLVARARTQQASAADAQRHAAAATKALNDARAAAATIASARTHATQAAQVACRGSEAIKAKPADPDMRLTLVEVQRNRAQAEQDVTITAGALDTIRAAFGAARTNAVPPAASGLANDIAALRVKGSALESRRTEFNGAIAETAAVRSALTQVAGILYPFYRNLTTQSGGLEQLREVRIKNLNGRLEAIDTKCMDHAATLSGSLDGVVQAAAAKLGAAETSVAQTAMPAGAPDYAAQIEAVFANARAEAELVAAEAVKAVRCEAAARTAMAGPAPPPSPPPTTAAAPPSDAAPPKLPPGAVPKPIPGKPNGLTCRYTRGQSSIEFTIYDVRACPPIDDYTLVSQRPAEESTAMEKDFGEKAQDFTGKWVDKRDQFWTFTITNGKASRFPISAQSVYVADDKGVSKWSGTCIRTGENKAECEGAGTWDDALRIMSYKVKVVMYVHSGTTITYDYEILTAQMTRAKLPTARPGRVSPGKFKGNPLTKQ